MDKYLVSLAVVLLFMECGWLLNDLEIISVPGLHHAHNEKGGTILGEITQRKKEVKRKTSSSLIWEETYDEQNLYAYDSVLTLDQSTAIINLEKQSLVTLQENTLVMIEPPSSADGSGPVRLHFKQGSMRTNTVNGEQAIGVGDWMVEAGSQTQLSIRSVGTDKFEIENHGGEVKVVKPVSPGTPTTAVITKQPGPSALQDTHNEAKILKAGQVVLLTGDQVTDVRQALEINWQDPPDGTRIYTHGDSGEVALSWKGKADEAIVDDSLLNSSQTVPLVLGLSGTQKLPLAKGNYTVQLKNSDRTTFARNIAVWEAPKIHLISPLTRQRIKLGNPVDLIWTLNSDVKTYQWQIASDREFKNILREGKVVDNKVTVTDLPLGEFYWRVLGRDEKDFEIPEMYFNTFNVITNPLEAPKLKAPSILPDESSNDDHFNERQVIFGNRSFNLWNWIIPDAAADEVPKHYRAIFQWGNVPGADSYNIEICETPDFRNPVVKQNVSSPHFKWCNFKLGQYYWRVAAQTSKGEPGFFSETAVADLTTVPAGPVVPVSIAENQALQLAKLNAASATPNPSAIPNASAKPSDLTSSPGATPVALVATDVASTSTPTPSPSPTPTPTPTPKPEADHWEFSGRGGGHGIASFFKGSNFQATQTGEALGDYRIFVTPPRSFSKWRFEGEYQTENLQLTSNSANPFQNTLQLSTFRVTAVHESEGQGERSWGFSVHDQNYIFQRADLQILSVQTPVAAGPFFDWRWVEDNNETEYRLGAYIGMASSLEARATRTYFLSVSRPLDLTLTFDSKVTAGVTTAGSFWTDGTVYIFLGVRWK